jgi:AbrB family looped-hinge helix DNA binding protein
MKSPFTTRISSRGQIVIPDPIRKALALEAGTTFLVLAQKDTIVLHRLQEPPWQAFDAMVKQAEKQATNHDAAMQGIVKFLKKMKYGR